MREIGISINREWLLVLDFNLWGYNMRIDLPTCGFKNCRYYFDGNCKNKNEYEQCDYTRFKTYMYYVDNIENLNVPKVDANRIVEARERIKEYLK